MPGFPTPRLTFTKLFCYHYLHYFSMVYTSLSSEWSLYLFQPQAKFSTYQYIL